MASHTIKNANSNLKFAVRLLITHPLMDPDSITRELKLMPHLTRMVGTKRQTPTGVRLPGKNKLSTWSYSFEVLKTRAFFKKTIRFLSRLENHKKLFNEIVRSGGSSTLIFELDGRENIGDVLPYKELKRLSDLKIDLGIEVYPEFG